VLGFVPSDIGAKALENRYAGRMFKVIKGGRDAIERELVSALMAPDKNENIPALLAKLDRKGCLRAIPSDRSITQDRGDGATEDCVADPLPSNCTDRG
jgi:hypothetical protein